MKNQTHYKIIIIGSGPAGLSAAIHTSRTQLHPLVITGIPVGGALIRSKSVTNWPGITAIPGAELIDTMYKHAETFGTLFMHDEVTHVTLSEKTKKIILASGACITADAVIIACGGKPKNLECPGAQRYWNKGIYIGMPADNQSYINKTIAIIGGGNSGIGIARRILAAGGKVQLIHPKTTLAANDPAVEEVKCHPGTTLLLGYTAHAVEGTEQAPTALIIQNQTTHEKITVAVDAVMVTIGSAPNTDLFIGQLTLLPSKHIAVEPGTTITSVPGVFAAGDIMDNRYRHAITSSGLGFMAGIDAENYLKTLL
jgi:thioredoxin reductase (NADPH)